MRRTLAAVTLLLCLTACGAPEQDSTYAGTIEFPDVEVGSLVGGRVLHVFKREGESATHGDVLVELDPVEWQSNLDEATAMAQATQRELDLLLAGTRAEDVAQARAEAKRLELIWTVSGQGTRPEEIEAAREDVKVAEARLAEAEKDVDRLQDLVRQRVEPAASLDAPTAARDRTRAELAAARQRVLLRERGLRPEEVEAARQAWIAQTERVKALEAGPRAEEIAAKRAILEAAQARIRLAEFRMRELRIDAPADCFVQTLDVRPGDLLRAGAPVGVLLVREAPWIIVYVPERDLARVHAGQAARIEPDGHPPLQGRVTWISRKAEYTPRNVQTREERVTQVFAVKVVLDGDASALKDGMWADVRLL